MSCVRCSLGISMVLLIISLTIAMPACADDVAVGISDIAWLAGSRTGIGDDGKMTGDAHSVWTDPVEGVMSWTFRWHRAEERHVHFAFSVIEESEHEVLLRGLHHGRNFDTFEETNWTMRLAQAGSNLASFVCVSNCRAASVEFLLLPDGGLKESWRTTADAEPEFEITYQRDAAMPCGSRD